MKVLPNQPSLPMLCFYIFQMWSESKHKKSYKNIRCGIILSKIRVMIDENKNKYAVIDENKSITEILNYA